MGSRPARIFDVTVTSKGQMTIPAGIRAELGIAAGDRLEVALNAQGGIEMTKKSRSYKDVFGRLAHLAGNRSVPMEGETDHAVGQEMLEQDRRSKSGGS